MLKARFIIVNFVVCMWLLVGVASASEVRVFKPMEEGVSPMALRKTAMAEGFAQAVLEEAKLMLPGDMDEVRTELFKAYLKDHSQPYIQGYKVLSSQSMEAGLILRLDVKVNKLTLRNGLKSMGLFTTMNSPQSASVVWPEDFDEASMTQLQGLMTLTGIQAVQGASPTFVIEQGPKEIYKARFELDTREWVSTNKDMSVVWFELWSRYFNRSEANVNRANVQKLSVTGWFSPDAALEFDRVLQSWDSTVQEVRLVELDMQPSGVGGTWEVRLLSGDRLAMLLQGYLPQRGLTYQISEDAGK